MKNLNKLTAISLAVAGALSCAANADVIISEYVEGSSSNKAIELYNTGMAAVDLSDYKLAYYSNGETDAAKYTVIHELTGTIAAQGVKVVINGSASDELKAPIADEDEIVGTKVYFNGDDPVILLKGNVIVDAFGVFPTTKNDKKYAEMTMRRNLNVTAGNPNYDESEWTKFDQDDFAGLGSIGNVAAPKPFSCKGLPVTPIHNVQGDGDRSPLIAEKKYTSDEEYVVTGIVTARSDRNDGFFMQATEVDNNDKTSEGIFVYTGYKKDAPDWIEPGKQVCVQGKINEYYGLTRIVSDKEHIGELAPVLADIPAPVIFAVQEGESFADAMERLEGMKIKLDTASDMKVTSTYGFNGRYNNMSLAHKSPLIKATQVYTANSDQAKKLNADNKARRLDIETDLSAAKGHIPYFPDFNPETGYMRVGDTLTNIEGAVGYSYGTYRLYVTNEIHPTDFTREVERADIEAPEIAQKGDLRVASFNVLNYFNDSIGGDKSALGQNRGATDQFEFHLQRDKIVSSIVAMNADIVALMEISNNGFGEKSAIQDLVNTLNSELSDEDAYSFITINKADMYKEKYFGTDAIMVGLIYRKAKVTPTGDAMVIKTPVQNIEKGTLKRTDKEGKEETLDKPLTKRQRHSLAQGFTIGNEKITVVVNHLKSKGSYCAEDWLAFEDKSDPADLQGHCNEFRVSAVEAIGKALKSVEGKILVLGDMNAYGKEDPLQLLTDYRLSSKHKIVTARQTTLDGKPLDDAPREVKQSFGYINLNTKLHGADTYSYKWAGELGNLDHALATPDLAEMVVAIDDWHINSAESAMFEYSSKYTGDLPKSDNIFSSSDHDPVIIAIDLPDPVSATPKPEAPRKKSSGSLGFLGLALLSLFGSRRRR